MAHKSALTCVFQRLKCAQKRLYIPCRKIKSRNKQNLIRVARQCCYFFRAKNAVFIEKEFYCLTHRFLIKLYCYLKNWLQLLLELWTILYLNLCIRLNVEVKNKNFKTNCSMQVSDNPLLFIYSSTSMDSSSNSVFSISVILLFLP